MTLLVWLVSSRWEGEVEELDDTRFDKKDFPELVNKHIDKDVSDELSWSEDGVPPGLPLRFARARGVQGVRSVVM